MKRLTLYFNHTHTGWSETWYSNEDDITDPIPSTWDDIFKKAVKFRGKGTVLYGIRQTIFTSTPKKSYFTKFGNKYTRPITDPSDQDPDVISTDALYYIYTVDKTRKRPVYLRGLVDADVKVDALGVDQPTTNLTNKINDYITALSNASFGMLLLNKTATGIYTPSNVTAVAPSVTNTNYSRIDVTPGMTLVPGNQVLFRGVVQNDLPGFPRIATVKTVPGGPPVLWFEVPYRYRASTATYHPVKMTATFYAYSVEVARNWQFWQFSEHKSGRPFGSLRGRRRAVVRAQ